MNKPAVPAGRAAVAAVRNVVFVFVLLSAGYVKAANVLSNPGFETGNLGGWTTYGANTSVLLGTAIPHSGSYYFKVYQAFNGQINYNGVFQDTASGPGAVYSADGWAYTLSSDALGGQNLARSE